MSSYIWPLQWPWLFLKKSANLGPHLGIFHKILKYSGFKIIIFLIFFYLFRGKSTFIAYFHQKQEFLWNDLKFIPLIVWLLRPFSSFPWNMRSFNVITSFLRYTIDIHPLSGLSQQKSGRLYRIVKTQNRTRVRLADVDWFCFYFSGFDALVVRDSKSLYFWFNLVLN